MVTNKAGSETVLVLTYEDDGEEGSTKTVDSEPYEYDEDAKKSISDIDLDALTLE